MVPEWDPMLFDIPVEHDVDVFSEFRRDTWGNNENSKNNTNSTTNNTDVVP